MGVNFRRTYTGITVMPVAADTTSELGDLQVLNTGRIIFNNGSGSASLLTATSTDTLTNKSLSDTTTAFVNASTPSKTLKIDLSGSSASTTLTLATNQTTTQSLSIPNVSSGDSILTANASQTVTNKTISGASNTITNISLTTAVSGILPIANGGTNASTKSSAFDSLSPMTTLGDTIYGGASGTGTRLAGNITSAKQFLSQIGTGSVSAAPIWSAISTADITGTVLITQGGTGQITKSAAFDALSPMSGAGDIIIGGASGTGTRLPIGSNGTVLTAVSGSPSWQSPATAVVAYNITNQTTAYSASPNDLVRANYDTIAGFATTMPDATTNAGKSVIIENVSTGYNVGTIVFVGGQTAQGLSTLHLQTPGELWELTSNGVGYDVIRHLTDTFTKSYTVPFSNTTGPAPTRGTIAFEQSYVSRRGRRARLTWNINQTGGGNNNGGSGFYTYGLPFTADTTYLHADTNTSYDGVASIIGGGSLNSSSTYNCRPTLHSTTLFKIWVGDTAGTYQSVLTGSWDTSPLRISVTIEYEVSGWED